MRPSEVALCTSSLFLAVQLCLVARFIFRLRTKGRRVRVEHRNLNLLCHWLIVAYTAMDWLHAFGAFNDNNGWLITEGYSSYCRILAVIFYYFATLSIYAILLHRLHGTFADTEQRPTDCQFSVVFSIMFVELCVVANFTWLMIECLTSFNNADNDMSNSRRNNCIRLEGVISAIATVCDYALNAYFVYLFVSKLRQMLISLALVDLAHLRTRRSKRLLYALSKQTVIGLWLVCLGSSFFTMRTLWSSVSVSKKASRRFLLLCKIASAIQGTLTMFVLDLAFSYADPLYLRLCGACHGRVFGCQFASVRKAISRKVRGRRLDYFHSDGILNDLEEMTANQMRRSLHSESRVNWWDTVAPTDDSQSTLSSTLASEFERRSAFSNLRLLLS